MRAWLRTVLKSRKIMKNHLTIGERSEFARLTRGFRVRGRLHESERYRDAAPLTPTLSPQVRGEGAQA
jgi:hypothetical protein